MTTSSSNTAREWVTVSADVPANPTIDSFKKTILSMVAFQKGLTSFADQLKLGAFAWDVGLAQLNGSPNLSPTIVMRCKSSPKKVSSLPTGWSAPIASGIHFVYSPGGSTQTFPVIVSAMDAEQPDGRAGLGNCVRFNYEKRDGIDKDSADGTIGIVVNFKKVGSDPNTTFTVAIGCRHWVRAEDYEIPQEQNLDGDSELTSIVACDIMPSAGSIVPCLHCAVDCDKCTRTFQLGSGKKDVNSLGGRGHQLRIDPKIFSPEMSDTCIYEVNPTDIEPLPFQEAQAAWIMYLKGIKNADKQAIDNVGIASNFFEVLLSEGSPFTSFEDFLGTLTTAKRRKLPLFVCAKTTYSGFLVGQLDLNQVIKKNEIIVNSLINGHPSPMTKWGDCGAAWWLVVPPEDMRRPTTTLRLMGHHRAHITATGSAVVQSLAGSLLDITQNMLPGSPDQVYDCKVLPSFR